MTNQTKRSDFPATADGGAGAVPETAMRDRVAAAKEISAALRQLKTKAQAQNLKMVAYLVNLAELEALDCAGSFMESAQLTPNKRA